MLIVYSSEESLDVCIEYNHKQNFEGKREASGFALGKSVYTAYLSMRVSTDGSFTIYDKEAGNPGILGKMTVIDDDTIILDSEPDDFDSPWPGLQLTDELEYHFKNHIRSILI